MKQTGAAIVTVGCGKLQSRGRVEGGEQSFLGTGSRLDQLDLGVSEVARVGGGRGREGDKVPRQSVSRLMARQEAGEGEGVLTSTETTAAAEAAE